ncbi:hypothetical protein [Mesorhizobium sp. M0058]|uniref:hypothetical protein n=1 Tax=Mesorhizobium sp. M0058 TaxID=2956865 RepID=UPI0033362510
MCIFKRLTGKASEIALLAAAWNDEREQLISLDNALAAIALRRRPVYAGAEISKHCSRMVALAGS